MERGFRRTPYTLLLPLVALTLVSCGELGFLPLEEKVGLIGVPLGDIAVITSDYDRVEEILQRFDIAFDLYDGFISGPPPDALLAEDYAAIQLNAETLLQTEGLLETYDIVWINCGARGSGGVDPQSLEPQDQLLDDALVASNLAAFVQNGGRLVIGDWSYGLLEAAFPQAIDFYGQDETPGDAEVGAITSLDAVILNPDLAEMIGDEQLHVEFPVSAWTVAREAEGRWMEAEIPLAGAAEDASGEENAEGEHIVAPLVIQQTIDYGSITFLSVHTEQPETEAWLDFMVYLLRSLAKE